MNRYRPVVSNTSGLTSLRLAIPFCALLFLSWPGRAQPFQFSSQNIGVDQGLSQSSCYATYQDRQGFLWIGTADGLNRYDGKELKIFKAAVNVNEPSNSNFVRGNIAEDADGNIWYTTENGLYEVVKATGEVKKRHSFSRKELNGSDFMLCFIDGKDAWMYSIANGMASYHFQTAQVTHFPTKLKLNLQELVPANFAPGDKSIWFVLMRRNGIYQFNTQTRTLTHWMEGRDLMFIRFLERGYFLVTQTGILKYDSLSKATTSYPLTHIDPSSIRDLDLDASGRLWICTVNNGLWFLDVKTKEMVKAHVKDLETNSLTNLTNCFIDRTENLWVGTDAAGTYRIDLKTPLFKMVSGSSFGLKQDHLFIKSMVEDPEGNIWIHSINSPLIVFNPSSLLTINPPLIRQINESAILFLGQDQAGSLWIVTEKKIFEVARSGVVTASANVLRGEGFPLVIHKVGRLNGQVSFATNFGVYRLSGTGNARRAILSYAGFITDMAESPGGIWVATRNFGLHRLKAVGDQFEKDFSMFPELDINSIHQDASLPEFLWLASDKGLIRFDGTSNEYRVFSEANGMYNDYVYGMLEDSKNQLWCSTNGGLTRFDKQTLQFTNYTVKDGLQNNEFNSGSYWKGASGTFYFGGVNGLNWFTPEEVDNDTTTLLPELTEFHAGESRLPHSRLVQGKLVLPYDQNDLNLQFSVFDFSNPESNKIKYQLKGWDKAELITYDLKVRYNNLSPGTYTLEYRASTNNNFWSKSRALEIEITPPFWEQWWFYAALLILLFSFIVFVVWLALRQKFMYRIAALEKQNAVEKERRRISMEMHDDIGASLTQIVLISETSKHTSDKSTALEQIAHISRTVVQGMGQIIWSLNSAHRTFGDLMAFLRDQLHSLLESTGIAYQINLPDEVELELTSEFRKNILLTVKEAVNNAVKHARATHITIEGKVSHGVFALEVRDDGVGFREGSGKSGNGLKNMEARVKSMHGSMNIISSGTGTTVCLQFDLKQPVPGKSIYH